MPEHWPKSTTRAKLYCPTCNRLTMHRIDNGRQGPCEEHSAEGLSAAQKKRRDKQEIEKKQPKLF